MEDTLKHDLIAEIENFLEQTYKEEQNLLDHWMNFSNENGLIFPLRDHLRYKEILFEAFTYLKLIHANFAPEILVKLQKDIQEVDMKLSYMLVEKDDTELLYTNYIYTSKILTQIKSDKKLSNYYTTLIEVIFPYFERLKYRHTISLVYDLKRVLNQKTFLFEKMLWQEANNTKVIKNSASFLHIYKLDTKSYLKHLLTILAPYSQKHNQIIKLLGDLA
jgi:hypothetical protein